MGKKDQKPKTGKSKIDEIIERRKSLSHTHKIIDKQEEKKEEKPAEIKANTEAVLDVPKIENISENISVWDKKPERPQNKNLKPFQPGESGNPEGKPKGILNYKTRVGMAIEIMANKYLKDYNKKHKVKITLDEVDILGDIFMQALNKARNGDTKSIIDLFDRLYGKAMQSIELTGKDGKAIEYELQVNEGIEKLRKFQDKWFKTPLFKK